MAKKPLRVAMIGSKFMGRAHSNAWLSAAKFFDLKRPIEMRTVCARDEDATHEFAARWGWQDSTTNWKRVVADDEIDVVDIATPNHVHAAPALAALKAGKHVACEKPLAGNMKDARAMRDAARRAKKKGQHTFVWFNYRRCPAVAFAHQLVRKGRLGRIYHVRAQYLQDWGGPETPLLWRFDRRQAGSGAHGDLNAHIVDMARFITGDEVVEVTGAIEETFVRERRKLDAAGNPTRQKGRSTVDDCVLFIGRLGGGATASFESTRLATGNQNRNTIEINGERGSLRFDFERMNELAWWDNTLESSLRGWSRIMCTTPGDHPYVESYWPPAHLIGYEHGFVSQVADMTRVLSGRKPVVPLPDFDDAYQTQRVLEAAMVSARERRPVKLQKSPEKRDTTQGGQGMSDTRRGGLSGPGIMLISAALFGYFGFMTIWFGSDPLMLALKWTLRAASVGFAVAAISTFVRPYAGNMVYAVVGIVSAVAFAVIGIWDLLSPLTSGIAPFLLFAFAIWNGLGAATGLRDLFAGRRPPTA